MVKKQSWLDEHKKGCKCSLCKEDATGRVAHYSDGKPICINCDIKTSELIEED
jgi:formylmethanofuran dehydrogenase subunit E